ncbi:hypothetical protein SLITO_v1c09210 [Spiroplasma litorale]|uniref:Lipoprotein n=1 Tax=Spiroplasma litorale TaxID=216942 RepID=A0A0K1W357_9MOLU|nr:hypothetical protein [Spiroplasma litorale]AKX34532.1 hypothetical protein SLITO_v1c09210 [Spiroplasma litorale]
MKKIISWIGSIGLIGSASSSTYSVVSCGKTNEIKSFTYYKNKGDNDLVKLFTTKQSSFEDKSGHLKLEDNKLTVDYIETKARDEKQGEFTQHIQGYEGLVIYVMGFRENENDSFSLDIKKIIVETKNLNKIVNENNYEMTFYNLAIKGQKGNDNFDLIIYKETLKSNPSSKEINVSFSKEYQRNIKIS